MPMGRTSWTTCLLLGTVAVALFPEMGIAQVQAVPLAHAPAATASPALVSPAPPGQSVEPAAPGTFALSAQAAYSLEQLAHLSQAELECLYRNAEAGTIPAGYLHGKALYCPTEPFAGAKSRVTALLWRGKIFDPCSGTLVNQWRGFRAIRARVYYGTSWLDGGSAIIMDYQGLSRDWADVRDEMRPVGPCIYLGVMYLRRCPEPKLKMFFALEAQPLEADPACLSAQ